MLITVSALSIATHTLIACSQGGSSYYILLIHQSIVTKIKASSAWSQALSSTYYPAGCIANYSKLKKKGLLPTRRTQHNGCVWYKTTTIDFQMTLWKKMTKLFGKRDVPSVLCFSPKPTQRFSIIHRWIWNPNSLCELTASKFPCHQGYWVCLIL